MAASPLSPLDARKIGSPTSTGTQIAEDIAARTRRSFGGRPVHHPSKRTPLLWSIFAPLTRKEETGSESSSVRTTSSTSIFSRESAVGQASRQPQTHVSATRPSTAKNAAWNRNVFEFAQTLSSFGFSPEKFNDFFGYASRLLCDNPSQNNQLNPALTNALIGELSRLSIQDRDTTLTNILSFQKDLLHTAQETGSLYETSAEGLIPSGQFASLVEQILNLVLTTLQPRPQNETNE